MRTLYQLAQFVVDTTFEDLPQSVIDRAKEVVRDLTAVIIAGMAEPEVRALAEHATRQGAGKATLFGHGGRVSPDWAVLVHGTAGTSLELDEGHAYAAGHPAIHAAPTALALAEARDASGKEALTAFILGYEVAARVGVATQLRAAVHPFGTWGVLGAAAIKARFDGLDAEGIAGVFELAASYTIAPSFASALKGANVRNTYAGVVNRLGMLAAELYPLGFRGEPGGVHTTFGEIIGESFDADALVDGLGQRFEITRGYFKPYSSCRYTHSTVEATLALRRELDCPLRQIDSVSVETYQAAARLKEKRPQTPLAGRFSVPYVVAACLVLGHAGRDAFKSEALTHPEVRALAERVDVTEDPGFSAMTPSKRPSRVTIRFRDGTQRQATTHGSTGDPDRPMAAAALEAKFYELASPALGAMATERLWSRLGTLEKQSASLFALAGNGEREPSKGGTMEP